MGFCFSGNIEVFKNQGVKENAMGRKASDALIGYIVLLIIILLVFQYLGWVFSLAILGILAFLFIYKHYGKEIASAFGKKPIGKHFKFLICDNQSEIIQDRWYRLERWKSSNYLKMETTWSKDWKIFSPEEPVVGVTRENREANFLLMGDQSDFKIFLEREKDNPVDPNAIKVIGSATVDGKKRTQPLGYLSKETALLLKDEQDLDARPHSVWLPYEDKAYGLRIKVLVRSKAYKKKMIKKNDG